MTPLYFFDLHCDTLTEARGKNLPMLHQDLQLDLARLPHDMVLAEAFAIFIPDTLRGEEAVRYFEQCAAYYEEQLNNNSNTVLAVSSRSPIRTIWGQRKHAAMLSVEGGAVLGGDLTRVELLQKHHVRMLTLTWNGENEIGGGAHSSGGLTEFGRALLPRLEKAGILIDVSHLNDETMRDVIGATRRPLVASHSDSRAVCDVPRNLPDGAFCAIAERGGLVGLNFYPEFLCKHPESASCDDILRHAEHFLTLGGEDVLALGSDFDGAEMPHDLPNAESLPFLAEKLSAAFGKVLAEKICYQNALDFFRRYEAE